jgi:imidazolonepropionase-like amidohydrolase
MTGPRLRIWATIVSLIVLMLCVASPLCGQEKVTAIKGGDIYTITSGIVINGTILIKDGKIVRIGQGLDIPKDANVVDVRGKVVMPGLVVAATMGAAPSTDKIADSLDPFNYSVSMALASGVTSIFVTGRGSPGGTVGGATAVIKPTYGDMDNMLLKEPVAENLNITSSRSIWMDRTNFILKMRQAKDYLRKLAEYEKAKVKNERLEAPRKAPDLDPYLRLLRREMPGRLRATRSGEILKALELVDEFPFRLVIEGGTEAWTVADAIAARDVAVIMTPRAKQRPDEDISQPSGSNVENAAILKKAGVKFAIIPAVSHFYMTMGGFAGRDLMTLPMDAAAAVSGGLDEQTALEAITITAAQILGVDDRVGSLQEGKDADIIVLGGHPFHYDTFVELTFVNGKLMYDKSKSIYFSHIRRYDEKVPGMPSDIRQVDPDALPPRELEWEANR